MSISDEQTQQIAQRLADGASIADIQRIIVDEFKISMTYMEVRFLIDDLDLEIKEEPQPEETEGEAPAEAPNDAVVGDGTVNVEIDKIKRPGAALSGSVVFSDGQMAAWFVDQYGRMGLDPKQEGYKPSDEDLQEFQITLQQQMQGPGI